MLPAISLELHIKIAFPFVILIMALIGIPVALWKKEMGTPVAVSIGISLCFAYLLVLGLSRSLGFAGILPPVLSAWLANSPLSFFRGLPPDKRESVGQPLNVSH